MYCICRFPVTTKCGTYIFIKMCSIISPSNYLSIYQIKLKIHLRAGLFFTCQWLHILLKVVALVICACLYNTIGFFLRRNPIHTEKKRMTWTYCSYDAKCALFPFLAVFDNFAKKSHHQVVKVIFSGFYAADHCGHSSFLKKQNKNPIYCS